MWPGGGSELFERGVISSSQQCSFPNHSDSNRTFMESYRELSNVEAWSLSDDGGLHFKKRTSANGLRDPKIHRGAGILSDRAVAIFFVNQKSKINFSFVAPG